MMYIVNNMYKTKNEMTKLFRLTLFGLLLLGSSLMYGVQTPKYIFLFIGDGMGFNHVEATQIYAEKVGTDTGERSLLFPTFPVMTQVCTRSASHLITCSSAAATALATGEKTTNYVIGMDAEKKHGLKSLARQLKDKGYKIGIITSASIDMLIFSAIATVSGPVIKNIIANINTFAKSQCGRTRSQTRYPAFTMGDQIMMVGSFMSSPITSISMRSFYMSCLS